MQFAITDRAAIEFSRTFYDGLARGLAVDGAVQEARIAISMALGDSVEWGTPVLYMRSPDGTLFHVDLAGAIFRRPAESPPVQRQPRNQRRRSLSQNSRPGPSPRRRRNPPGPGHPPAQGPAVLD